MFLLYSATNHLLFTQCNLAQVSVEVVFHLAVGVKDHSCLLTRGVVWPLRNASAIGIAGAGEVDPSTAQDLSELDCSRRHISGRSCAGHIVEDVRNLSTVGGGGSTVDGRALKAKR